MRKKSNEFEFSVEEFEGIDGEAMYEEFLMGLRKSGESYISIYDSYVDVMLDLSPTTVHLLTMLTFSSEINTGRIILQSQALEILLKKLGMAKSTFYRGIKELKGKGIIKGKNAKYYLNPRFVWKGTNEARSGYLKIYPTLKG